MVNERSLYESFQNVDCADEESSPIDLHSPSESLSRSSPLRVAPSEGTNTLINRDNNSSVRIIIIFFIHNHIYEYPKNEKDCIEIIAFCASDFLESRIGRKC